MGRGVVSGQWVQAGGGVALEEARLEKGQDQGSGRIWKA